MIARIAPALLVVALVGCTALGLYPRTLELPRESIERALAARMPYTQRYAGLVEIELTRPRVALAAESNRIATTFDVSLRTPFGRSTRGLWTLSGVPRYDAESQSVRLDGATVDALELDALPASLAAEVKRLAERIAREVLAERALYTLKPEDLRFAGGALEPVELRVVGDRLVVPLRPR